MLKNIKIRQMTIDDISAVYKLGKETFIEEKKTDQSYVYGYWTLIAVAKVLQEYIDLAYVASNDNSIIGFVLGHPSYEHFNEVGYLEWLAVDKDYRKKGIAQNLVKSMLNAFKKRGLKRVVTDVKGVNIESSTLFQKKLGFSLKESVNFLEIDI